MKNKLFNWIEKEIDKTSKKTLDVIGSNIVSEKKIGIKVRTIMQKPVFVSANATKKELFNIARKNPSAKVFVVADKNKRFKGDIYEDDLFLMLVPNDSYSSIGIDLALELQKKFFAKNAKELMRKHSLCCNENDDLLNVALSFVKSEINEMPVLNGKGQVVGVITQGMLMRHLKQ